MRETRTGFAEIETDFPEVGSERRTFPRSQNVMLERGRGLSEDEKKSRKKRYFARSRRLRITNYLTKLGICIALSFAVIGTYFIGLTYFGLNSLEAGAMSGLVPAIATAWVLAHPENRKTIADFRRRSDAMFTAQFQEVSNSEYWFGSQPVQFLFDDKHFMIAGVNDEYYGYIPLSRILQIETWEKGPFVGKHETPALWLTIEGAADIWAESNILIPGHFFEEITLDRYDSQNKFARFRESLRQSCKNLRAN